MTVWIQARPGLATEPCGHTYLNRALRSALPALLNLLALLFICRGRVN